ncbi:MAG TPA: hypothetical protein VFO65_12470, partial [Acidimicrobiales bacterium]|nr:hypothetical protein [Acidimicrobiales bacterium]
MPEDAAEPATTGATASGDGRAADDAARPAGTARAAAFRRPRLAVASARAWVFPGVVLTLVVVLGLLGLSGSSLGRYAVDLGASEGEAGIVAGPARAVRSDEWTVRTPWALRQAELGLPSRVASAVGDHDVAVLADLPTGGWEGVVRPHTLVWRVLDPGRAFAVEWWSYFALQLLGVYALLLALTRRPVLAALGAALVTLSPATQWWAAPGTFTTVGYGCLSAALLLFAVRAPGLRRRLALGGLAGLAGAAFLVALYVPWQIGTALVVGPVVAGALVPPLLDRATRWATVRAALVAGLVAGGVAVALFGAFVIDHREAVGAIADTVYPGRQEPFRGGTVNLAMLWGSALDSFAAQKPLAVVNGTNQSENATALVLLLPVGLACLVHAQAGRLRAHPVAYPLLGSLLGGGVLLAWALLPVPASLGRLVLLGRMSPGRTYLPLGLAGAVAAALLAHYHLVSGRRLRLVPVAAIGGLFAAVQLWAAGVYTVDGATVSLRAATVLVLVVTAGVVLALGRRPVAGLAVLAGFCLWQASLVNPVQRGLDPLTETALRRAVEQVAGDRPQRAGWIAFGGDVAVIGTLTAAGVNTLSAVSPYPDADAWRVLDPDGRFEEVWNRYARVAFVPGPEGGPTEMKLIQPDAFVVTVDPCAPELTALDVEIVVTQDFELSSCTRPLARVSHGDG